MKKEIKKKLHNKSYKSDTNKIKTGIPVIVGKTYEMTITHMESMSEGIGSIAGYRIFVPYGLLGEKLTVEIVEADNKSARGKILHILQPSPQRVVPACQLYETCGGCQLQHLSYEGQLEAKHQQVVDAVMRCCRQKEIKVYPVLGAEEPWNYRNKMQLPVGKKKNEIVLGCFVQGSHEIIDTEDCCIQKQLNNDIANVVRDTVKKLKISVYDEDRHVGILRYVVGRVSSDNKECMLVLVTAVKELRYAKELVKILRSKLPHLVSVQQNVQTYHNNVIMGRETNLLWGKDTIRDRIGKLTFHISPRSFFQINTKQAEVLYNKALEYAALTGRETVIDAYCGTGTITLFLARKAQKVYGIEIVKPAIFDARKNARENHIKNVEFIVGDATVVMPSLYHKNVLPDVIVVDPPRSGCTEAVLKTFASMGPKRIVYISCNPESLARDLAILDKIGYVATKIQPVDMFPQTYHVECVALIEPKQQELPLV